MDDKDLIRGALDRITGLKPIESSPAPQTSADWLKHWRELAQVTLGIAGDDPRYEGVMRWLNVCDTAFSIDSWSAFCEAAEEVKAIVSGKRATKG